MPLLDHKGRLFGKLNLFDAFVIVIVVTLTVLVYRWLTVDYRVAPPYALDSTESVVRVELQLPRDQVWLCEVVVAGLEEVDPRSGEARARVLSCTVEAGVAIVVLYVYAVEDSAGRLLFEGVPLVPGRTLDLETETVLLNGVVRRVTPEPSP